MEVFSKRAPLLPEQKSNKYDFVSTSPAHMQDLFERRLTEICARFDDWSLPLRVRGTLGSVVSQNWRRYDPWPLFDETGEGEIGLEVTPFLIEQSGVTAGDRVEVLGLMRARLVRGQVVLRFEVLTLAPYQEFENDRIDDENLTALSILRDYPPTRRAFPDRSDIRLFILGLGSDRERIEILKENLGGVWQNRPVQTMLLKGEDEAGFRQALLHNQDDVVVILAGEQGCAALERPAFLLSLAVCKAYRLLVRDRSMEADLSDGQGVIAAYLVESSFTSVIEAGRYLRQESGRLWREKEEERARQEELSALRESLAHAVEMTPPPPRVNGVKILVILVILGGLGAVIGILSSGH